MVIEKEWAGASARPDSKGVIAMERDFARQLARAKGDARAASQVSRAFRPDEALTADAASAAGAAYVMGRRRNLKAAVAEASAFPHAVDPVARELVARRR